MARRRRTRIPRLAALLLGLVVLGACSTQPVSEANETSAPATAAPDATTSPVAPSEIPSASPADGSPAATPGPTRSPARRAPDKPGKVTFKEIDRAEVSGGGMRVTFRLTWTAPEGVADRFLVYGITRCLREEKAFDGKPCLVKGMPIPKKVQEVIATVPGSVRTVDVSWKEGETGPGPYFAVLVRASNDVGDSIFAIAWSESVCWKCTY